MTCLLILNHHERTTHHSAEDRADPQNGPTNTEDRDPEPVDQKRRLQVRLPLFFNSFILFLTTPPTVPMNTKQRRQRMRRGRQRRTTPTMVWETTRMTTRATTTTTSATTTRARATTTRVRVTTMRAVAQVRSFFLILFYCSTNTPFSALLHLPALFPPLLSLPLLVPRYFFLPIVLLSISIIFQKIKLVSKIF
jgi:hypothetical protein